ncbi:MAG: SPFH domain-containing protein [Acidimicrobiales bacterium]
MATTSSTPPAPAPAPVPAAGLVDTPPVPPEREITARPGIVGLGLVVALLVATPVLFVTAGMVGAGDGSAVLTTVLVVLGVVAAIGLAIVPFGFFVVRPGQARVLVLLGRYLGTVKKDGWYWANPFAVVSVSTAGEVRKDKDGSVVTGEKRSNSKISLRIRNLTTPTLKVNDAVGNPIEIGAIIVWQIADTARAVFAVEDVDNFVLLQTETAVRHLGTEYAYDSYDGVTHSLRANPDEAAENLAAELRDRLAPAGVRLIEARVSHLAYATEIAEAMLRRQQADAVVAARRTIVAGAVGMVEDALELLSRQNIVELDEERKASMVSNLMVVLTSEHQTHPVVNVGSLY